MLLVLLACSLFGTIGTARVLGPSASSSSVGGIRLVIAAAVLAVVARLVGGRTRLRPLVRRPAVLLAGLAQVSFNLTFLTAVEATGVAVGTLVAIGSAPVFTGLLTRSVERVWLLATGLAVSGVGLLTVGGGESASAYGVLLALVSGLSYALYTVASRSLAAEGHPPAPVVATSFAVAAVLMAPALAFTDNRWALTTGGAAMVLYLGVAATAGAYLLFVAGLRHVPAPTAQTLGLIEPVVATTLGVIVLDERLPPMGVAGCLLVLAGLGVLAKAAAAGRRQLPV